MRSKLPLLSIGPDETRPYGVTDADALADKAPADADDPFASFSE